MANYSTLKAAVADVVKTNGEQAITGANLQSVLLSIINSVGGGGYIFKGVATPSTDAGTPDENVFYIGGAGTYANFGTSVTIPVGSIGVFKYNGTWNNEKISLVDSINSITGYYLDSRPNNYIEISVDESVNPQMVTVVLPTGYYQLRKPMIKYLTGTTLTGSDSNYYWVVYDSVTDQFLLLTKQNQYNIEMTLLAVVIPNWGSSTVKCVCFSPFYKYNGVLYEPFSKNYLPGTQKTSFGAYLDTRNNNIIAITQNDAEVTVVFPSGLYLTSRGVLSLTGKTLSVSSGSYKTAYYDHTLNDFVLAGSAIAAEDKTILFEMNTGWGQQDLRQDVRIIGIKSPFLLNGILYYPQSPNYTGRNNNFGKLEFVGQNVAIGETFDIASAEIFNVNDDVLIEKLYHSKKIFNPNGTISTNESYWTIIIPVYLLRNVIAFNWDAGVEKIINGYNANYEFVKNYRSYYVPASSLTYNEIVNDGCAYLSLCYRVSQVSGKYIHIQHGQTGAMSVFCSSSLGDDTNDGTSETTPVKTLEKAVELISAGETLKLKCGDVFFAHQAINAIGYNVESYGYGELPVITHFMIISGGFVADPEHGVNIWKINLATATIGGAGYDSANNNVGFVYNKENDTIVWGHKVNGFTELEVENYTDAQCKTWLQNNGDFLQRDNMLYVYSTDNPNNYQQLFLGGIKGGIVVDNAFIRNVKIVGCNFGITAGGVKKNIIIENVELDLIGGCSGYDGTADFFRWGNGFEFWVGTRTCPANIRVKNCRISRVFDAGASIQGNFVMTQEETNVGHVSDDAEKAINVYFSNNIFSRCRQAYEAFSRLYDVDMNLVGQYPMENCVFENNICVESGNNEFNSPEIRDTNLLTSAIGMIIRGNAFWGGGVNYRHLTTANFTFGKNNTFYVLPGDVLFNNNDIVYRYPIENDPTTWIGGATTYQEAIDNVIALYRSTIGDQFSKIIGISSDELNKYADLIRVS